MRTALSLLLACALLAGCGKRGSPEPPGPKDRINYPQIYPAH